MGLLGKMMGRRSGKKTNGKPSRSKALPDLIQVQLPDVEPFDVPEGEERMPVYVYDGRPLKGMRRGQRVRMEVAPNSVHMKSIYTGTSTRSMSRKTKGRCVTTNGYAVGYLSGNLEWIVAELSRLKKLVTVSVEYMGMSEWGWPIFEAIVPTREWFCRTMHWDSPELREADEANPLCIRATIYSEFWYGKPYVGDCTLKLVEMPPPEGSSAKPHIAIKINNRKRAEANARMKCYPQLVKAMEGTIESCEAMVTEYEEGFSETLRIIMSPPADESVA